MKVVLVMLLKCEDSLWRKAQKYLWHHNLFGHPSSLHQHRSEQLLNDPSQIIFPSGSLNTKSPTLLLLLMQSLKNQFLPPRIIGSNTNKGRRNLTEEEDVGNRGGVGWRGQVQGGVGDTFMVT